MPGKAKSAEKKAQICREEEDLVMEQAVAMYHVEQEKVAPAKKKSLRVVCREIESEHKRVTGREVHLDHGTLNRLYKGGQRLTDFNATKSWLLEVEVEKIIEYALAMAERGFPLSHKRLKEHVDDICHARLGDKFPAAGVGANWTERFVTKHSKRLTMYTPRPLDSKRARAVNPTTNAAWFKLLGETLESGDDRKPIAQECCWGVDESGFQSGLGATGEKAIGGARKKSQYQQGDATRENITVLVTIGADGTSLPPAVIFKGKAYQPKWNQDNPTNASLGYSKKGWTDGEIGILWIEQFDEQTRTKADGRARVLLVDGHNSHYMRGFLEYARKHNIHMLCYPAHATHVYQGLDVAVFSVLKRFWAEEREKWEREKGEKVNKENFLAVYGAAHVRALTPEIISSAFRKTGVWPYDPSVVTTDMMAPSIESSNRGHLPLAPSTPVRIVSALIRKVTDDAENPFTDHSPGIPSTNSSVGIALHCLASTSAGFLVNDSPIRSTSRLPEAPILPMSAQKKTSHNQALLNVEPTTELEKLLQRALHETEVREAYQKERVVELQCTVILQGKYLDRIRHQLEAQEGKKNKGKSTKLVGDGWPRLLTGDTFYTKVIEHQLMQRELADAKKMRKEEREKKAKGMAEWKTKDNERKKRNDEKRGKWKEATAAWELERDRAKLAKQRAAWRKPVLGKMESPAPRPKASSLADIDEENEEEDDTEDEDDDE